MKAMKKMKVILVAVTVIMLVVGVNLAQAASKTCYVNYVGVNGFGKPIIQLTDTAVPAAFTNQNFLLNSTTVAWSNSLLSVGLTAMASGMKVMAIYDVFPNGTVSGLALLDQ
jgi:hypothetical protein